MASSARHARRKPKNGAGLSRSLRAAGVTVTAAGAALAGGHTASAAPAPQESQEAAPTAVDGLSAVQGALGHAVAPLLRLPLHPTAGTGVDPLSNSLGTQIADFPPVSTDDLLPQINQDTSAGDLLGL